MTASVNDKLVYEVTFSFSVLFIKLKLIYLVSSLRPHHSTRSLWLSNTNPLLQDLKFGTRSHQLSKRAWAQLLYAFV